MPASPSPAPQSSKATGLVAIASSDGLPIQPRSGCGRIVEVPNPDRSHVPRGQGRSFPSLPPASGAHDPRTLPAGAYEEPLTNEVSGSDRPTLLRAVHSLEHGYVIVFYRPSTHPMVTQLLTDYGHRDKVIVAPEPQLDAPIALVAWERIRRRCAEVDATAIEEFITAYSGSPNAPEPEAP